MSVVIVFVVLTFLLTHNVCFDALMGMTFLLTPQMSLLMVFLGLTFHFVCGPNKMEGKRKVPLHQIALPQAAFYKQECR